MLSGARVVFWDFDGTLATRDGLWSATMASALELVAPGLPCSADDFRIQLAVGFPWHEPDIVRVTRSAAEWWAAQRSLFRGAYAAAGVPKAAADAAIEQIPAEYYRPTAWTLVPDAIQSLEATVRVGYRNVILSNHAPELPTLVAALGLEPWVDLTITSASVGAEKPNPRIFRHALKVTAAGDDVWMVGDNPVADIVGARQVGIRAVLVGTGVTLTDAVAQITSGH